MRMNASQMSVLGLKHVATSMGKWVPTPILNEFFTFMGVDISQILNLWDKSASNKHSPNWAFNILLERTWSVHIKNGSRLTIWSCELWTMNKRKAKNQIDNLTHND
jgi:hypothetical protein